MVMSHVVYQRSSWRSSAPTSWIIQFFRGLRPTMQQRPTSPKMDFTRAGLAEIYFTRDLRQQRCKDQNGKETRDLVHDLVYQRSTLPSSLVGIQTTIQLSHDLLPGPYQSFCACALVWGLLCLSASQQPNPINNSKITKLNKRSQETKKTKKVQKAPISAKILRPRACHSSQ